MSFDFELTSSVRALARTCGLGAVGIAPAGPVPHADRFRRWLDGGYAAGMDYLAANVEIRYRPALLVDGA